MKNTPTVIITQHRQLFTASTENHYIGIFRNLQDLFEELKRRWHCQAIPSDKINFID